MLNNIEMMGRKRIDDGNLPDLLLNATDKKKLWFLAAPYTGYALSQMEIQSFPEAYERNAKALRGALASTRTKNVQRELLRRDYHVLCYITMMFMIETDVTDPFDKPTEWWLNQSVKLVERSEGLLIITFPGWDRSRGVAVEVGAATITGKPIYLVNPDPTQWK